MPSRHTAGPGQEAFFTREELVPSAVEPVVPEPNLAPVSVNVAGRAFELSESLKALNRANMSAGMRAASATPHRADLEKRYGSGTDERVKQAGRNESIHIQNAKRHFARASGMYAMLAAGYDREEVTTSTARMFDGFTARYGVGIASAKIRNTAAKRLKDNAAGIVAGPKKSKNNG